MQQRKKQEVPLKTTGKKASNTKQKKIHSISPNPSALDEFDFHETI